MIDWNAIVKRQKYNDVTSMLQDLYITKLYSLRQIGRMLIVSDRSVANQLRKLNIRIRPCGGANNKGGYKQKQKVTKNV